ncbi:MAG: SlyX protein [uncultured Thiotrichaceae bacterium]|uniref:SlyX protein n=1 Tax=uncultured Thiotrichaceae bacterium TaxID=298394 RepID=A0A6S6S6T3_9GAMM|nr:MAG: SlyX protein [uncultured Thiotrichaceae bacterium]
METRIAELEIKFMEQEATLESLSEQVYLQQQEITHLTRHIEVMKDRLKSMAQSPIASMAEETPPPHY